MQEIKDYFSTLSKEDLQEVTLAILYPQGGGGTICNEDKPTSSPTPNGSWDCRNGKWVWIPGT